MEKLDDLLIIEIMFTTFHGKVICLAVKLDPIEGNWTQTVAERSQVELNLSLKHVKVNLDV